MTKEKRKYKRYIFPNDEKLSLELQLQGKEETIKARLLKISEGGVGIAVAKDNASTIKAGVEILIKRVTGVDQLQSIKEATGSVRWVLNHKPLEHLGVGCKFTNLSDAGRKEITDLVNI